MPFTYKIGDTFNLPDGNGKHRWVILTKPNTDGLIVLVNFTDAKNVDSHVIFNVKDDKTLFTKRTTVYYENARLFPASKLKESRIDCWKPCQLNHVKKIVSFAFISHHTPIEILEELKTQYPDEYKQNCTWDYSNYHPTTSPPLP